MINYWSILRQAFHTTVRYPALWVLGLFLAGGFNANFFYWANLRLPWRDNGNTIADWLQQTFHSPPRVIVASLTVIVFAGLVAVLVNWAKVTFVLYVSDALKLKRMRPSGQEQNSLPQSVSEARQYLLPVLGLSIFTMVSMMVVVTVLGGSSKILFQSRGAVWTIAVGIFIVLVFFFSCLNIFASLFVIFFKRSFASGLNLALDLIVSRWQNILEMVVILMVIYALGFFVGTSLLFMLRAMAEVALQPLARSGLFPAQLLGLTTGLGGLLLWLWLAMVNAFFNVSMLLLFAHLVKPPFHPEFKSLLAELPLAMPGAASMRVDKSPDLY